MRQGLQNGWQRVADLDHDERKVAGLATAEGGNEGEEGGEEGLWLLWFVGAGGGGCGRGGEGNTGHDVYKSAGYVEEFFDLYGKGGLARLFMREMVPKFTDQAYAVHFHGLFRELAGHCY